MSSQHLAPEAEARLQHFLDHIGDILGHQCRRASFATYALGLLSHLERKSMEPIAAQASGGPARANAAHQKLQYFITESEWEDGPVRLAAARYALAALERQACVVSWIVDDTGFLKQGEHSVGVQRQYTGSAGKTTNCQVGVSLTVATPTRHLPVDFALYLPRKWVDNPARRKEAKIPDEVSFKTKSELALEMIREAMAADLPPATVLADADYGSATAFRTELKRLGLDYAVGIGGNAKVWRLDKLGRRQGPPVTIAELAQTIDRRRYRRVSWRAGTKEQLTSRFARERVVPYHDDGTPAATREAEWLLFEWPLHEERPTKYYLTTLPQTAPIRFIVHLIKCRWRTERMYQEMKGELGLDHFEGRRYAGWHHHVSVALCCYAFVVAEQALAISPYALFRTQTTSKRTPTSPTF
jgi:SRSO17 transposase